MSYLVEGDKTVGHIYAPTRSCPYCIHAKEMNRDECGIYVYCLMEGKKLYERVNDCEKFGGWN